MAARAPPHSGADVGVRGSVPGQLGAHRRGDAAALPVKPGLCVCVEAPTVRGPRASKPEWIGGTGASGESAWHWLSGCLLWSRKGELWGALGPLCAQAGLSACASWSRNGELWGALGPLCAQAGLSTCASWRRKGELWGALGPLCGRARSSMCVSWSRKGELWGAPGPLCGRARSSMCVSWSRKGELWGAPGLLCAPTVPFGGNGALLGGAG